MVGGVQLSLKIGPVPMTPPHEVTEALIHAKVEDGSGGTQSGFELVFELPARSPLRTLFLVSGGGSLPLMRVVLVVTFTVVLGRLFHSPAAVARSFGRRVGTSTLTTWRGFAMAWVTTLRR